MSRYMMTTYAAAALVAASLTMTIPARSDDYTLGDIQIDHPWSRETPAGAGVGAGYMVVRNMGDTADALVGGETAIAGRVEVHEMAMENGVMKMRPLKDGLEIPPGGEVVLKPGGYHLMFMDLNEQIIQDQPFSVMLMFRDAGAIEVEFDVEGIGARESGGHDHGNHDQGDQDQGGSDQEGQSHGDQDQGGQHNGGHDHGSD